MLLMFLLHHVLGHILGLRNTTATSLLPLRGKRLGKLAAISDLRTPPVEDVNGDDNQAGQGAEDGRRIVDGRVGEVADVVVQRRSVHGRDTRKEVASPCITACGRGGVDAVGRDHVVDRGEVDGVVCDADEGGENHGHNPVGYLGALGCPGEAE